MGSLRSVAVVLLVALATLALGGTQERTMPLHEWTLVCDRCVEAPVRLPGSLSARIPPGTPRFTLRAEVPLPTDLRGRELTLTLPIAYTFAHLRVDDEDLEPLDESLVDRVRPADFMLAFRIPARLTDRSTLPLALTLEGTQQVYTAVIPQAPRLGVGPFGDPASLLARGLNRSSALATLTVAGILAVVYLLLFALDRRRRADGYFGLLTVGLVVWSASASGIAQLVDARDMLDFPIVGTSITCLAGPCFVHAHFGRPLRRALPLATIAAIGALGAISFLATRGLGGSKVAWSMLLQIVVTVVYMLGFLGWVAWRGPRRFDAAWMLASWALVGGVGFVNPLHGVQITPAAWILFVLAHAALLARAHVQSLREVNATLADRIASLQERNREVATLNEELRRQVGDRSARLVEALARAGKLATRAPPMVPGSAIGDRYLVRRLLGEGGMGAVYEVERVRDGKGFAMKIVSQASSPVSLARLAREAEVATKVRHPHVVGMVDVDVSPAGLPYIVMELVDGEPLSAAGRRLGDARWAQEVLRQVAAGLVALHDAGVVHRDLKPSNVLLERTSGDVTRARIADFGIARLTVADASESAIDAAVREETPGSDSARVSALASTTPELTRTGVVLGTPHYMAPELAQGAKAAMPASDMWSFGVMAFQLASGRLPFDFPPALEATASAAWKGLPPDTSGLPAAIARVVRGCLQPDPDRRMTAREVEAALSESD